MGTFYYPSCKLTAALPKESHEISQIVQKRFGMTVLNCCRNDHRDRSKNDTIVYVCNTCAAICEEDSEAEIISIWEIIDRDDSFPYPDYHGKEMVLQDCWRSFDRRKQQDAVRSLLKKMNIQVIELQESYEKVRFCGTSLYKALPIENGRFAPKRFVHNAGDVFLAKTEEEQIERMKEHCLTIPTESVVCYCVSCAEGLRKGGKKPVHLLELLLKP